MTNILNLVLPSIYFKLLTAILTKKNSTESSKSLCSL